MTFEEQSKLGDKPLRTLTSGKKSVEIWLVDADFLVKRYPEWEHYWGSHHWGVGTDYIPSNEIWISNKTPRDQIPVTMVHEVIERPIMAGLEMKVKLSAEAAWEIGHPIAQNLERLLMFIPQLGEEVLIGGLADYLPDSNFDSSQLERGEDTEKEHIGWNPNKDFVKLVAREITKDHLVEFPNYYDYLGILETLMGEDKKQQDTKYLDILNGLVGDLLGQN